jgi:hypothetical protein
VELEQGGSDPGAGGPATAAAAERESVAEVDLRELDAQLAERAVGSVEPERGVEPAPVASALPSPADARVASEAAEAVAGASPTADREFGSTEAVRDARQAGDAGRSRGVAARVAASIRPATARVLVVSARTLERCPKVARDTLGWIGLVTVFFACCMWAIVLFFRSTPVPEAYGVPSEVLEPGDSTPQGRPRPRPSHADAGKADDSSAGDHGEGGGGGGGH